MAPWKLVVCLLVTFLILSVADLVFTWQLIEKGGGAVLESNPVANWSLMHGGWFGLTAFKLGMVVAIGLIAAVLACRSLRVSELVLVFACGAQAAIVLHSSFLDRLLTVEDNSFVEMSRTHNPQLQLLSRTAVQKDLQLSEEQQQGILRLAQEHAELTVALRQMGSDERELAIDDFADRQKRFLSQLTPSQNQRLGQIALQNRGLSVFLDEEIERALRITPEQRKAMVLAMERPEKAKRFMGKTDARTRILNALTEEQRTQWLEMVGPPFRGETVFAVRKKW